MNYLHLPLLLLLLLCNAVPAEHCGNRADHGSLLHASGVGDVKEVRRLLLMRQSEIKTVANEDGTCNTKDSGGGGPTLLMAAAHAGAVDVVRVLLGLDPLNPANSSSSSGGDGGGDERLLLYHNDNDNGNLFYVNEVDSMSSDKYPWDRNTAAHFALDGWFWQATGTYALFNKPFGEPVKAVAEHRNR